MKANDLKNFYIPILVFILSVAIFFYSNYSTSKESVEKQIILKASHDPKIFIDNSKEEPSVKLLVEKDKKSGVNVKVEFKNFILTPQSVSTEDRPNEGHMHLYVNGFKIARVYSEWFHIDGSYFNLGENKITVTLNANDHSVWTKSNGDLIQDTVMFTKSGD
jgi:hypothetical protein